MELTLCIVQPGKVAIRVRLRIYFDRDTPRAQLRRHRVEVPDAKVHHPGLLGIAEVVRIRRGNGANAVGPPSCTQGNSS